MRIAGPSLALSLVLLAAPAFAQSSDSGSQQSRSDMQQSRDSASQDRYEITPSQQGSRSGSTYRQSGQAEQGAGGSNTVSVDTRAQIKDSLEKSGFKNITVLPQAYLIRAQAPDGSRVVMQVSPEGLYGVVTSRSDEERSGGSMQGGGMMRDRMHRMMDR